MAHHLEQGPLEHYRLLLLELDQLLPVVRALGRRPLSSITTTMVRHLEQGHLDDRGHLGEGGHLEHDRLPLVGRSQLPPPVAGKLQL